MTIANREPVRSVVLVTTSGCHFCDDAKQALDELSGDFRLHVRIVDAASAEGWALVGRHRPAFLPLVVLDGERFSYGLLPRKKLRRVLEGPVA